MVLTSELIIRLKKENELRRRIIGYEIHNKYNELAKARQEFIQNMDELNQLIREIVEKNQAQELKSEIDARIEMDRRFGIDETVDLALLKCLVDSYTQINLSGKIDTNVIGEEYLDRLYRYGIYYLKNANIPALKKEMVLDKFSQLVGFSIAVRNRIAGRMEEQKAVSDVEKRYGALAETIRTFFITSHTDKRIKECNSDIGDWIDRDNISEEKRNIMKIIQELDFAITTIYMDEFNLSFVDEITEPTPQTSKILEHSKTIYEEIMGIKPSEPLDEKRKKKDFKQ